LHQSILSQLCGLDEGNEGKPLEAPLDFLRLSFKEGEVVKKILLLANIFAAGFCFGQAAKGIVDLTGGYFAHTIESKIDHTGSRGFPIGLSWLKPVNDTLGVGTHINFIIPSHISGADFPRLTYVKKSSENVLRNGGDNSLFGFDALVGPSFMLSDGEKIKIPFTVGPHIYVLDAVSKRTMEDTWPTTSPHNPVVIFLWPTHEIYKYVEVNFGIGYNIGVEWYLTKRVYLLGRIQGSFDFVYYGYETRKITGSSNISGGTIPPINGPEFGWSRAWSFVPQAGIGIRF
jgi:hypothetical protein